jgi:hypothetical protein
MLLMLVLVAQSIVPKGLCVERTHVRSQTTESRARCDVGVHELIKMSALKTPWLMQMKNSTESLFFCPAWVLPMSRNTVPIKIPKMMVWTSWAKRTILARITFCIALRNRYHTCANQEGLKDKKRTRWVVSQVRIWT